MDNSLKLYLIICDIMCILVKYQ